jgi:DNA polymerase-4
MIAMRRILHIGYQEKTVTVKVRFSDFKTYTRAKSLDGFTDSEPEFRRAAFDCLNRFELKKGPAHWIQDQQPEKGGR